MAFFQKNKGIFLYAEGETMGKRKKMQRLCASWLIACLLIQLVFFSFPASSAAASNGQMLQKTIRVTEQEIERALNRKNPKTEVKPGLLPFKGEQREEAETLLNEILEGAVIVKQEKLGNRTAALVAAHIATESEAEQEEHAGTAEQDTDGETGFFAWGNKDISASNDESHATSSNADLNDRSAANKHTTATAATASSAKKKEASKRTFSDLFLIGLNANKDKSCIFRLEVIGEGGIWLEDAVVSGYSASGDVFGPGIATSSEAEDEADGETEAETKNTENAATKSNAANLSDASSESNEADTDSQDSATPSEAANAALHTEAAENAETATSSKPDSLLDTEEEILPFRELYEESFDETELAALVRGQEKGSLLEKTEEAADGVRDTIKGLAAKLPFAALKKTATSSEAKAATASEAERIAAEEAQEADENQSTKRQAPGMYAEALGISVLHARNAAAGWMYFVNLFDPAFATKAFLENVGLTENDALEYAKVEATFQDSSNVRTDLAPHTLTFYNDGVYRTAVPDGYDTVRFTVFWYEAGSSEIKQAEIAQDYQFRLENAEDETAARFALSHSRDCFYYSGYKGKNENEQAEEGIRIGTKLPGLSASYWSAHPTQNPQLLDDLFFYIRIPETEGTNRAQEAKQYYIQYQQKKKGKASGSAAAETGIVEKPITLEANSNTRYYQFPQGCRADETTLLQLLEKDKDGNLLRTYPFVYVKDDARNLLYPETLSASDWQERKLWGSYQRQRSSTAVLFNNTLNQFDLTNGKLLAVIWSTDAAYGSEAAANRPKALAAQDAWETGKLTNEQQFLALLSEGAASSADENKSLEDRGLFVTPLYPTTKESAPNNYDRVKNSLGAAYPNSLKGDISVRFVYYPDEGSENEALPAYKTPAASDGIGVADAGWDDAAQRSVFAKLHSRAETAFGIQNNELHYQTDGNKSIYNFTRVLDISRDYEYPCYFAAIGIHSEPMQGKWDSAFAINTLGDSSQNVPIGTFQKDNSVYYGTANLYDYYSDYELTGNNREPYFDTEAEDSSARRKNPYPATPVDEKLALGALGKEINGGYYNYQGNWANQVMADYYKAEADKDRCTDLYPLYLSQTSAGKYYHGTGSGDLRNSYVADQIAQGIMADELDAEGNLQLLSGKGQTETASENSQMPTFPSGRKAYPSLHFDESFLRGANSASLAVAGVFRDVVFPFRKDVSTGNWSFDSAVKEDAMRLKQDNETGTYYMDQSEKNAIRVNYLNNPPYQFFPFSNAAPKEKGDNGYGGKMDDYNYGLASLDHMFGMRLDIPFTLTADGKIDIPTKDADGKTSYETKDMVFNFSGDDDVWIYIDGKLALDLGGIHDKSECSINFAQKTVTYSVIHRDNSVNRKTYKLSERHPKALEALLGVEETSNTNAGTSDSNSAAESTGSGTNDADLESKPYDPGKQHTISIFYMERGLVCSNLKIEFNFKLENSFEVKNDIDKTPVENAIDDGLMNKKFSTALDGISGFQFKLQTAATRGVKNDVKNSLGYIDAGTPEPFSLQAEENQIVPKDAVAPYKKIADGGLVVDASIKDKEHEGRKAPAVAWAQGQSDTDASAESIQKRLVNVYPLDKEGKVLDSVQWEYDESAEDKYLSFDIYQSGGKSALGGALYVGLLDGKGKMVGGWANALSYENYGNPIQSGKWSRIRISQKKLAATNQGFDWRQIKAFQFCYYDDRLVAIDNIDLNPALDKSNIKQVFSIDDEERSDFGSISEDGSTSSLTPAAGAWYNVETNPQVVDSDGSFSLGMGKSALFTDKFRRGSYLSVQMQDLDKRIFDTVWSLQEDGENIKQAWLAPGASEIIESTGDVNPIAQDGREPKDGRKEKDPSVIPNLGKTKAEESNTVLYRSFRNPSETQASFHIGTAFLTTPGIASVTVTKSVQINNTANLTEEEKQAALNADYGFVIVYDDIADMSLETTLDNPLVADFFTVVPQEATSSKAPKSVTRQMIAGTHYRIYELSMEKDAETGENIYETLKEKYENGTLTLEEIKRNAAGTLKKVFATPSSYHDGIAAYPDGNKQEGSMEAAEGIGYTRNEKAEGTDPFKEGNQRFHFVNEPQPKPGTGKVELLKIDEAYKGEQVIPVEGRLNGAEFALYFVPEKAADGTQPEPQRIGGVYTTGVDETKKGTILITNLAVGSYYFEETKAPDGYQKNPKHLRFQITQENINKKETVQVQMYNKKIEPPFGSVQLKKVAEDKTTPLRGACFQLFYAPELRQVTVKADGEVIWNYDTQLGKEGLEDPNVKWEPYYASEEGAEPIVYTTGADGMLKIDALPAGGYYLVETKAPDGYRLDSQKRYFEIFVNKDDPEAGKEYRYVLLGGDGLVINYRQQKLPTTGGNGYADWYLLGFGLMGTAGLIGLNHRRKRRLVCKSGRGRKGGNL